MSVRSSRMLSITAVTGGLALAAALVASPAPAEGRDHGDRPDFTLTILHNNDGESSLVPTLADTDGDEVADTEFGGIARFQRKVDTLRIGSYFSWDRGESLRRGVVLLNSGDNFLAGTTFQASEVEGAPFYDGVAVRLLRYDALAIGNHEFDFGPATFRRFVDTVNEDGRPSWLFRDTPFVSANLDYSGEPALADLAGEDLVSSTVVHERGRRVGVVGLTTVQLPTISSPGGVEVLTDLAAVAQAEVDALTSEGIDKIILVSHLQGIESEVALVGQLRDVDVVIGGGGDEVLADPGDELFPGDADDIVGSYPQVGVDAAGVEVPVVTTPGNYRYVGQLQVTFDRDGDVVGVDESDSGLRLVTESGPEAVGESRIQERLVQRPVQEFVDELATTQVGTSEVVLDCERSEVRGAEANCGNLLADALLAAGREQAAEFGVAAPQVAFQNGGGIRGEVDQPAGPITVADTFRIAPFSNFVSVAEDVPAETFRQVIEEGAIRLPEPGDGGFVHLAGASVVIDPSFPARVADQTTGEQLTPGERVRSLVLDDGTVLVEDGVTVAGATVTIASNDFSLGGGDAYPAVDFTRVGVTYQQALQDYVEGPLGGVVSESDYPRGGEGRITIL